MGRSELELAEEFNLRMRAVVLLRRVSADQPVTSQQTAVLGSLTDGGPPRARGRASRCRGRAERRRSRHRLSSQAVPLSLAMRFSYFRNRGLCDLRR
ncbi:hypothetical protein SAMN04489712_105299 [Thermomonospora echinospora]|uniref:Uncharacterized protein n=1 Tax=Thermomonospora echinospora TaxID=1992 RepID=A0A1H6AAQ4_9ACTN|nr:hypothetical protein [Thermomonospora echinospora]SEG45380.1 hypothetical protein SAMN04489712_105299 [Thermomonospora echinospora]